MHPIQALADVTSTNTSTPWWAQILILLLTILSSALTLLVPILVKKVSDKYHLEAKGIAVERISDIVIQGISYAEEQAQKAITAKAPPSSSTKMDWAVAFIISQLQQWKLPTLAAEEIKKLVEAHLPQVRQMLPSNDKSA